MNPEMHPPLTEQQIKEMIKVAKRTRGYAFAHRSQHKVGASVLTASGAIYGWCNVESVISGLGTCAERCAVDNAVAHGEYDIVAVCTIDKGFTPTCGACLQYILLFSQVSGKEVWLINGDVRGNYEIKTLTELLPDWYRSHHIDALKAYSRFRTKK